MAPIQISRPKAKIVVIGVRTLDVLRIPLFLDGRPPFDSIAATVCPCLWRV